MTESLRSWLSSRDGAENSPRRRSTATWQAVEKQVPLLPGEMPDFLARLPRLGRSR